jgi:uncharacterized protein
MSLRRAAIGLSLLLMLASPATAGPFEDAQAAHARNDHATALLLLKPLAEEGHVEAQKLLGYMYEIGQGVPQEYFYAATAQREAFKMAEAAHEIGDNATALPLLTPLADKGYAQAQKLLGYMYEFGQGVPQDYLRAAALYGEASARGNGYARVRLANLTARGVLSQD